MRAAGLCALAAALVLGGACSEQPAVEPLASAPAREEPAVPATTAAAVFADRLAPGSAFVELDGEALSVIATAAPRLGVLERVAEAAAFELVIEALPPRWPPISTELRAVTVPEALPELLGTAAYATGYAFDPGSGAHRLVRVVVGSVLPRADVADPADLDSDASAARSAEAADAADVRRRVGRAERRESIGDLLERVLEEEPPGLDEDELVHALWDPDPDVRMRSALFVDPTDEDVDRLAALLASDEDPRVRAAAASTLEDASGYTAIEALVGALDDPEPEVLVEVIEALSFAGDETLIPRIEPFLESPHEQVREAAADAIDFLE